jgi:predicted O-linked N-acetylglucosamine transferase (SPINDLY family)
VGSEQQIISVRQAMELGVEHHRAGRLAEAERIYRQVLKVEPRNADALYFLGVIAHQVGSHESAVQLIEEAIGLGPPNPHFHNDLGEAYRALRRPEKALSSYDGALAIKPDYADALDNRGLALQELGRCEEALASYDKALAIDPGFAEALNNRGNALQELKRHEEALASYDKALAIKPGFAKAANNRGVALEELRRHDEALASYDAALALKPDYAEALDNRGLALYELKRYEEALACYDAALAIKPDLAQALYHRGNALNELERYEGALASYDKALAIKPDYAVAHASSVHLRQHLCEWAGLEVEFQRLRARLADDESGEIAPFTLFAIPGIQPGEQLSCARRFAEGACGASLACPPLWTAQSQADGEKLRIGYLSADFRDHPVGQLVVETIEFHDRNRFEVFGYSYGVDDRSSIRRRLQGAFDTFRDVARMSDGDAARLILDDRVQILVDLTGYTRNARLAITALRPASVQVSWLGYPGTLGHPRLADYIIGDTMVSPPAQRDHFSESLALMPHCFQPNDRQRAIAERPTREAVGLPPEGFVFSCFNQSFKLNAQMFDVWCRLLAAVPGSVLWLLGDTAPMQRNLRREAQQRGISEERLIFAPRVAPAQHLARLQVADLFLDTLPCNAGATGSDALWAGLPLVTCIGETFAGRYAASLLAAAAVPELVTRSLEEYGALARKLATDTNHLAQIRAKLAANRATCALFDSRRFTRDLEDLLQRIWTEHRAGRESA